MTFEQDWAELRAAAAERTAMQINSVPAEGGGGGGGKDLEVNRDDLGAIGNDAYDLLGRSYPSPRYVKSLLAESRIRFVIGALSFGTLFCISIFWKAFQRSVISDKVPRLALETWCFWRWKARDMSQQEILGL